MLIDRLLYTWYHSMSLSTIFLLFSSGLDVAPIASGESSNKVSSNRENLASDWWKATYLVDKNIWQLRFSPAFFKWMTSYQIYLPTGDMMDIWVAHWLMLGICEAWFWTCEHCQNGIQPSIWSTISGFHGTSGVPWKQNKTTILHSNDVVFYHVSGNSVNG